MSRPLCRRRSCERAESFMTPEQWLLDETREWAVRAGRDLALARRVAGEFPAESLFHCQQSAEKWLKAFLTWHQVPFRKTHELRELGFACGQIDASLAGLLEPAYLLSSYAWRFRLPRRTVRTRGAGRRRGTRAGGHRSSGNPGETSGRNTKVNGQWPSRIVNGSVKRWTCSKMAYAPI
ncbi:MAG: HEPN domain-containing protein [Bryobacteraceae bacterium]